ncbi:MAG: protein kinase domain-containing protein [Terriglobia bacterium]
MNCPSCDSANANSAARCGTCGRVLFASAGVETFAAGSRAGVETEPLLQFRAEAVGVETPPPSPISSGSRESGDETAFRTGINLEPGAVFGPRYRIESILGRGGMGVVYKAYDRELDRTVALKLVRPDLTLDPESIQRFKQELLLASRISHKNVLRIHDLGDVEGVKFITMAFIEGEDLHHLLQRERRCSPEKVSGIGRQLAAALDAAHTEGVIHRDLKPQNVLVDRAGQAYVMDFGLAKSLEADAGMMTRAGALLGTPRYMSPEQVEGKPADARSDLYALGLILYEMATGHSPFPSESVSQMMIQRLAQKPKDPRLLNPALPKYLSGVILRCLETDPANRYQSAREIEQDLTSTHTSKAAHNRSSVQITLAMPATRRSRVFAGLAAVVVVVIAAGLLAYRLTRPHAPPAPAMMAGVPSLAQGKFVAVLPFRVLGDQANMGYLAEGLNEALTAKLFALRGVHVAAPGAVDAAMKKGSLAKAAKDLGVNLAVQGTLQGGKDRVAVFISLEDVTAGRLLWEQEFTGVPADLLTLEDQISGKLLDQLEPHPGTQELAREMQHPTENVAAYDLYLKGREAVRGLPDAQKLDQAIGYYKGALKQDPSFALAYAGLADASLRMYNDTRDRVWMDEATAAASQAQQLNSNLPEVYIALGNVYSATGKGAEAIQVIRRAVALAPNSDEGYRQLGKAYEAEGDQTHAVAALQKGLQIDPFYWVNADELGKAYDAAGDYAKALGEFQQVTRLAPDNAAGYENVGNIEMLQGNFAGAIPPLRKALQISPRFNHYSNLGSALLYTKSFAEAAKTLEKAVALSPNQEAVVGNLAEAYLYAGEKQKAQATFNKAIALAYKQLQVNPRDSDTMADLAVYYADEGQADQALQLIRGARAIDPGNAAYAYYEAVVEAISGQTNHAMTALQEALQKGFPAMQAASDPELGALTAQPDFKHLVGEFARNTR